MQIGKLRLHRNRVKFYFCVSDPVPTPDFPTVEFPSMEGVSQSQIDFLSISDTLYLRETSISSKKGSKQPENRHQHEEMRETANLNISTKPTQFKEDSNDPMISRKFYFREKLFQELILISFRMTPHNYKMKQKLLSRRRERYFQ